LAALQFSKETVQHNDQFSGFERVGPTASHGFNALGQVNMHPEDSVELAQV
jgi:hypothetical protein